MGMFGTIAFGLCAVAVLFTVIGLSTDYWLVADATDEIHAGLWRYCFPDCNRAGLGAKCEESNGMDCDDDDSCDDCNKLNAVRAATILGMICGLVGLAVGFKQLSDASKKMGNFGCNLLAGLWLMIGAAIWIDQTENTAGVSVGYSCALVIVAWLMHWGAAMLAVLDS